MPFLDSLFRAVKERRLAKEDALALLHELQNTRQGATDTHPFLNRNTSDLSGQRYTTSFTDTDRFATRRRAGPPVLLEGVLLEMARAATLAASGERECKADELVRLEEVALREQLSLEAPRNVHITLDAADDGAIHFEVYGEADGRRNAHGSGLARFVRSVAPRSLPITDLWAAGTQKLTQAQCYESCERLSLQIEPQLRCLQEVVLQRDQTDARVALAKATLLPAAAMDLSTCALHPHWIEAALQSWVLLTGEALKLQRIGQIEILSACPESGVVCVHARHCRAPERERVADIHICDAQGRVCIAVTGASALRGELAAAGDAVSSSQPGIASRVRLEAFVPATSEPAHQLTALAESAFAEQFESLVAELLCARLQQMGLFRGGDFTIAECLSSASIQPRFERWLTESVRVLCELGYFRGSGPDLWASETTQIDADHVWREWNECRAHWLKEPALAGQVGLLEPMLRALPEILQGKRLATDIMFPPASLEQVEGVYQGNPVADYFNDVLAGIVAGYVGERLKAQPNRRLRLLEIGAGTGATTARVIAKLEPYREWIEEYRYTDVSRAFLVHGERAHAPGRPYMKFGLFNVERPPRAQALAAGTYDVVIAANVLHATRNIRRSLAHVRELLEDGALLALNEMSRNALCVHLTFGLLDGWWLYEDAEIRLPGCPALSAENWALALEQDGFDSVQFPVRQAHVYGQQTIVALNQLRASAAEAIASAVAAPAVTPTPHMTPTPPAAARVPAEVRPPAGNLTKASPGDSRSAQSHIKAVILASLCEVLNIESAAINSSDSFADYGVDSIIGGHVVQVLNRALALDIATTVLFDHPSVDKLTKYIGTEYGHRIQVTTEDRRPAPAPAAVTIAETAISQTVFGTETVARPTRVVPPVGRSRRVPREQPSEDIVARLLERDETRASSRVPEPIAVIGMSGRYPKSANLDELWEHLRNGDDLIEPVSRWDLAGITGQLGAGHYCPFGGFMPGFDEFDPLFFNISGVEATCMDPQHRLFLQEAWHALEDAGHAGAGIAGRRCGVYVGCNGNDHQQLLVGGALPAQAMWGNSSAILSARISYCLDLQGPAVTIDTACSSSAVAIHLACQGLWSGETDLGIAGGVFVHSTPAFYLLGGRASMLSQNGRCYTFDERADGFVPGEGVGVLVLKRLRDAQSAGDHIHGVIRASGINQDGTTNGITAPSARSQERLEREVYERFGIDPRDITLVEAHGTATRLGDPIEYEALKRAFGRAPRRQPCALGSIKTNIGHTLAAAGVAGVIKVLLALKHREIPPSLHFETANSHIDFSDGPFFVNTRLREWRVENGCKRLAAVSSFGFSGTNAHLVIGEAPEPPARTRAANRGELIVLSARTSEALRRQVQQLVAHCGREPVECAAAAYTLMVGRRHFSHRIACVAEDARQLVERLGAWLKDGRDPHVHVADVHEGGQRHGEALSRYGQHCILQCQRLTEGPERIDSLRTIADLYCQGYDLPYEQVFANTAYERIALPTYPFATDRYWYAEHLRAPDGAAGMLHPLLHRNTSDFNGQRFSSRFTGQEFFLADHVVSGTRILPGAAYLELACAAVLEAQGNRGARRAIRLRDVVWQHPFAVGGDGANLHISLRKGDSDEIRYSIFSDAAAHSEGSACLVASSEARLDVESVRAKCPNIFTGAECYAAYRAMRIEHGASLQGLAEVRSGKDEQGPLVVARLALSEAAAAEAAHFGLHPGLMDSAFQASIGLLLTAAAGATNAPATPLMPFALDSLTLLTPGLARGWVVVRPSSDSTDRVRKLDLTVCDDEGRVAVELQGVTSRQVEERAEPAEKAVLLAPVWEVRPMSPQLIDAAARVLVLGGAASQHEALEGIFQRSCICRSAQGARTIEEIEAVLAEAGPVDHIVWLPPQTAPAGIDDEAIVAGQQAGVLFGYRLIKALLNGGYGPRSLELTVVTVQAQPMRATEAIDPTHASIHGLFGSVAKEQSSWRVRVLDMERNERWPWAQLLAAPPDPQGNAWGFRGGEWYRQILLPCDFAEPDRVFYREGGTYVLIGGAGGIGAALTEHLVGRYRAHVVWIGRRAEDEEIRGKRAHLAKIGPQPDYIRADATRREELERAYREIKQRCGDIHGVVHTAIVLLDRALGNMDEARFRSALAAKADISLRIAQVFAREPLDFVLFFSGLQSFGKMPGQSNYAAGCTFKDAFAHELARVWPCRVKVMNWGYWGSVGIVASDAYRQRMTRAGIGSIEPEDGVRALARLLGAPLNQLGFIKTAHPQTLCGDTGQRLRAQAQQTTSLVPRIAMTPVPPLPLVSEPVSDARVAEFDDLLAGLLSSQLRSLVSSTLPPGTLSEWRAAAGIAPRYARWLAESVRELEARGYVRTADGGAPIFVRVADSAELWARWNERKHEWLRHAKLGPVVSLTEASLQALLHIITGAQSATDVLFPSSSMQRVEGMYKDSAPVDYFNAVLATLLVAYVEERLKLDPAARIRLLEVGAGTGGTSQMLFEALAARKANIEEYCYTDISRAFLLHAEDHYAGRAPYLTYRLFDVERSPREQGIDEGAYDVVIATNVLHATRSIRASLNNTKAVLKGNGLLLINEIIGKDLPAHLTFGLLDGWWRFQDDTLRIPGGPALSVANWQRALEDVGFRGVGFPAAAAQPLGQQIIFAESDGVIREQPGQPAPVAAPMPSAVATAGTVASPRPGPDVAPPSHAVPAGEGTSADRALREKTTGYLKQVIASTLRIPVNSIEAHEPLERYGIDSLLVLKVTDALRKSVANVSSTLLFEHRSIAELVEHFLRYERPSLLKQFALVSDPPPAQRVASAPTTAHPDIAAVRAVPSVDITSVGGAMAVDRRVAVIGLSGRYPRAHDLGEYWENLKSGRDCIREIPPERWPLEGFYCADVEQALATGKSYCKWGGFVEDFAAFDAAFFNISPRDAHNMDPQERLFLQSCWDVLEDAGYTRDSLARQYGGHVGVFAGVTKTGFELHAPQMWMRGEPAFLQTSFSSLVNRVSYFLDLHGPSLPIDTMCSASLTAIHEACEHLLRDECKLAIAGGVNLYLHPRNYADLCAMRMLSPAGRCKSFGRDADGMVPGEGVGAVLLKPLSAAVADGDHIYGVIRGTCINHGGRTNGYTVPNPQAQGELVRAALGKAGVHARTVSYLESHGTGTELGDPIEITGLRQAFAHQTADTQFCAIGSVKSNIGHAESAAGIAAVTKVLLQMKHGMLVPSLHTGELNPHIDFSGSPFVVQRELAPWRRPVVTLGGETREYPRMAGVSSFGAGGSNAHVLIEEYPAPAAQARGSAETPVAIVLSAKDESALKERAQQLLTALTGTDLRAEHLLDMAYTLQVGREALEQRLAFLASSVAEVRSKLERLVAGEEHIEELYRGEAKRNREAVLAFEADEDLKATIDLWVAKGKLARVLDLWVKGLAFDWTRLYGILPRRISLPTYPFKKTRFWLDHGDTRSEAVSTLRTLDDPAVPAEVEVASLTMGKPVGIVLEPLAQPASLSEPLIPVAIAAPRAAPPVPASSPATRVPARSSPAPAAASISSIGAELTRTLAEALCMEAADIDGEKPFAELGLDSIIGVEWTRVINRYFKLSLPASALYDFPCIELLSKRVASLLASAPESLSPPVPADADGTSSIESAAPAPAVAQPETPISPQAHVPVAAKRVTGTDAAIEPIAVIGMSARYPGARTLAEFWKNLAAGRDCVGEIPASRWSHEPYYDPRPQQPGKIYSKWLGALDDVDCFDPLFFGISPAEAELLDPQQRLFLEESYRAFENAGYSPRALGGSRCGVYLGISGNEYSSVLHANGVFGGSAGSSGAMAAARIAYILNLKGPAIAIDTVCSSSLVATHLACQALRNREIDMALGGGVTLYLTPGSYLGMCAAGMLSPHGRCKTLDNEADGFVPGEGVGTLVLKRLSDAERDGDSIHGLIVGSGINQDGRTNGITAPSGASQAELEREVYERHGIHPETITCVEMHGTGTKLGDPVELGALATVFGEKTRRKAFCALGSVKSNIGHTTAAAGVAGVHKVLLSMRHRQLAPTLHYHTPNEHVDLTDSPFYVNTTLRDWQPGPTGHRRAAISSFGLSGTNAHIVVDEYLPRDAESSRGRAPSPTMWVLSAKDTERLEARARELHAALATENLSDSDLESIAYTLQVGRDEMPERLAFLASSIEDARAKLARYLHTRAGDEEIFCGQVQRKNPVLNVFRADEDVDCLIRTWLGKHKFAMLLDLWVKGWSLDWKLLYGERPPRRIPLPGYPFARERYWVSLPTPLATPPVAPLAAPLGNPVQPLGAPAGGSQPAPAQTERLLEKRWRPAPIESTNARPESACIFASPETEALATRLASMFRVGHVLSRAPVGSCSSPEPDRRCDVWIDLTGCGSARDTDRTWIPMLQRWIEQGSGPGTALFISRGLERLSGDTHEPNLAGALRAGLYRMLGSEYGRLSSRHVDTDLEIDDERIVEQICTELGADGDIVEVCYRKGVRWAAHLSDVDAALAGSATAPLTFEADQVVWITGGTRGLGALCAQHLVDRYGVQRLVLGGRTALPPREQWGVHRGTDTDMGARIRTVEALEARGAKVHMSSVPLHDVAALRVELAEVHRTLGKVGGVVHCAGVVDLQTPAFVRKSVEQIDAVLLPKVAALDNLMQCLSSEPLRLFVLFSSVSAVVPGLAVGLSDYAMANAYMDYVALARPASLRMISIQWPGWSQTGFGAADGRVVREMGLLSQTDAQGLAMLDRIIAIGATSVVLPARVDPLRWHTDRLMRTSARRVLPVKHMERPPLRAPDTAGALLADTRAWLCTLASEHLKIERSRLDCETPLHEYGVDSIMLTQMLRPISIAVGAALDPSLPFEYPTLDLLAGWLVEVHGAALGAVLKSRESVQVSMEVAGDAARDQDIAVIGLAGRFPGSPNLDGYWQLLVEGRSAIGPVPAKRGKMMSGTPAGLLDDIESFDAGYFQLSEGDAAAMDPQALIVLEESLHALYHAGYAAEDVKGRRIGVYVGGRSQHQPDPGLLQATRSPMVAVGQNYLAANVSRFFDLRGPSLVVDTACSSALVAMSLAIQALRSGEIGCALVGGVSMIVPDRDLPLFAQRGLTQQDSSFHLFDRRARGAVYGEGAGMLVLKTVAQARADGDTVHAVINAIATNNDGHTMGPNAPNMQAQREVMISALRESGLRAEDISHIDVNGSGSHVRDLIELKNIEAVYGAQRTTPCELGSMKPNIGHPMCAEGIASVIKIVLMLREAKRVPFLSALEPMAHYDFDKSPFRFCRAPEPWSGARRAAAVNCFADGGTNAHVVLSSWTEDRARVVSRQPLPAPALKRMSVARDAQHQGVAASAAAGSGRVRFWGSSALHRESLA